MQRALTCFSLALGLLTATVSAASADTTKAWCVLFSANENSAALPEPVRCQFGQRQGNVTVRMNKRTFNFPASEQGKTYQRDNHSAGIGFSREGEFTLVVFWQDPRQQ